MPSVEFTQFLMPNGRQKKIQLTVDEATAAKADIIAGEGYRFEIEMLSDMSTISIEICKTARCGENLTLSSALEKNGPAIPVAIKLLIEEAFEMLPKKVQAKL
jgi:hypothetical protein